MSYVIAIGGTGARFLEGLVHLCAAGLGPQEEVSALIIDPDTANGNIVRLRTIMDLYGRCKGIISRYQNEDVPIFKTPISPLEETTPVPNNINNLNDFFSYFGFGNDHQRLCELFYTEAERRERWGTGFKGRANLGASVMADIAAQLNAPPWNNFMNNIKQTLANGICKIFIAGSIFGATGASGFPAVAKMLRDHNWNNAANLRIGGILVLPYFSFNSPDDRNGDGGGDDNGLYADAGDFLVKTKSALSHYAFAWSGNCPYDRVYFIGDSYQKTIEGFSKGGMDQQNPLTPLDLISATSLLDFVNNAPDGGAADYRYAGRQNNGRTTWEDIPCRDLKQRFSAFTVFVLSYKKFIKKLMEDDNFHKKKSCIPWYLDSFEALEGQKQRQRLEIFREYMECFHLFIREIVDNNGTNLNVDLFDGEALDQGNLEFGRLFSGKNKIRHANDKFFKMLCKEKRIERGDASGDLFNRLYRASSNFCKKYYKLMKEEKK